VYSEVKSQNSNCSAKLVEAEALVAAGETKIKYLQIVSEQERKLEELRIQKQIEIARAKAKVYSSHENHLSESVVVSNDKAKVTRLDHNSVSANVRVKQFVIDHTPDKFPEAFPKIESHQEPFSKNSISYSVPLIEPDVFVGNPLRFPAWKISFDCFISKASLPVYEKLSFLSKYVGGEARRVYRMLLSSVYRKSF
jgi:hypothetical protein